MTELKEFTTLVEAQAYSEITTPVLISSDVMTMFLVQVGLYAYFTAQTDDMCLALMDRIRTQSQFNFINGDPLGEANKLMMTALIATHLDETGPLTALQTLLIDTANPVVFPYADSTEEQLVASKLPPVVVPPAVIWYSDIVNATTGFHHSYIKLTQPSGRVKVWIEECVSSTGQDDTWTEWKVIARFPMIENDIETFEVTVRKTTAPYRKLRHASSEELFI